MPANHPSGEDEMPSAQCESSDVSGTASAIGPFDAMAVSLMETMLGVLQHCQEAVLQDDNESWSVIWQVLGRLVAVAGPNECHSTRAPSGPDGCITKELEQLLQRLLESTDEAFARNALVADNVQIHTDRAIQHPLDLESLASWFHVLGSRLSDTHPQAVAILRHRLAGLGTREVAERLQLPTRLVLQVLERIRKTGNKCDGNSPFVPGSSP
jgi:hypothetical protein